MDTTTISPVIANAALKRLFDQQMAQIEAAGLAASQEIKPLYPLIEKIRPAREEEGIIPLVIVVQKPELTFSTRMANIIAGGRKGVDRLGGTLARDLQHDPVPPTHYLIAGVEDGRRFLSVSQLFCRDEFRRQNRMGATVFEGLMALTFHPDILFDHFVDLPGSNSGILFPRVSYYAIPQLSASCSPHLKAGSMSCQARLQNRPLSRDGQTSQTIAACRSA